MLWTANTSLSRRGTQTIKEEAAALGRDPEALGFQASVAAKEGDSLQHAIEAWGQAGGTHATVSPARAHLEAGPTGRALIELLPRLREEVGDAG